MKNRKLILWLPLLLTGLIQAQEMQVAGFSTEIPVTILGTFHFSYPNLDRIFILYGNGHHALLRDYIRYAPGYRYESVIPWLE